MEAIRAKNIPFIALWMVENGMREVACRGCFIVVCVAVGGCMTVSGGRSVPAAIRYIIAGGSGVTGTSAMAIADPIGGK